MQPDGTNPQLDADRMRVRHMLDAASDAMRFVQGRGRADLDRVP
jgi:hypothetical protein